LTEIDDGNHTVIYQTPDGHGKQKSARAVVLACGMGWRRLDIPGLPAALQAGRASYGPRASLEKWDHTEHVVVYGGGPAAGQAIIEVAEQGAAVTCVCRGGIEAMPSYLSDRIRELQVTGRVRLLGKEGVASIHPSGACGRGLPKWTVALRSGKTLADVNHVMLCNGLEPQTDWLSSSDVELTTNRRIAIQDGQCGTNVRGVYAVGDCREGSTARVGSAIGDGSMVVTEIWKQFGTSRTCSTCKAVPA
jgi:thioredoxin reductase (NADPH)